MTVKTLAEALREQEFLSNSTEASFIKDDSCSAQSIIKKLEEHELPIASVEPIAHATQIRLCCGAIVNVFDSGNVVLQGAVAKHERLSTLTQLQKALPTTTRCCL
jgi:hypothetical protein